LPGQSLEFVALSTGTTLGGVIMSNQGCDGSYGNQALQCQSDSNGDGRDHWYCISTYTQDMMPLISYGTVMFPSYALQNFCTWDAYSFGDWNGDGMTDAACANNGRVALQAAGGQWIDQGTSSTFC